MRRRLGAVTGSLALGAVLAGCGGVTRSRDQAVSPLPASYVPLTVGLGPRYRPPIRRQTNRTSVAGLGCRGDLGSRVGVHLELFANRHVVLLPSGIGVAGPVRSGAFVRTARCYLPLVTLDPTGVVEVGSDAPPPTLRDLFSVWGQPLGPTRLGSFAGHPVHAFVNGRPIAGDPARIRLRRHDEIVLETAGYVVPHDSYGFADG